MKALPLILLCFITHAFAQIPGLATTDTTISWTDTKGWMQVQDAISYETVLGCEGFISSCNVSPGSYIVINHSDGTRQSPVEVSNDSHNAGQLITFQAKTCNPIYVGQAACSVECPAEKAIVGITTCEARLITESASLTQFLPTSFMRERITLSDKNVDVTLARCRAHGDLYKDAGGASMQIIIEVACK